MNDWIKLWKESDDVEKTCLGLLLSCGFALLAIPFVLSIGLLIEWNIAALTYIQGSLQ